MGTYKCDTHGAECEYGLSCPQCVAEFENRRPADQMTGEEKVAEFRRWFQVTIPFEDIKARYREILGRDFYTTELLDKDRIEAELLSGNTPSEEEQIVNMLNYLVENYNAVIAEPIYMNVDNEVEPVQ